MALCVAIYLAMNRLDLAERQLKMMQDVDDEDVLSGLAASWVYLAAGGERVQEAYLILQELVEKHGPTATISNCLAVCMIAKKSYADALQLLKEAREQASNAVYSLPDILANTLVCLQLLHDLTEFDATEAALKKIDPNHIWFRRAEEANRLIDAIVL